MTRRGVMFIIELTSITFTDAAIGSGDVARTIIVMAALNSCTCVSHKRSLSSQSKVVLTPR